MITFNDKNTINTDDLKRLYSGEQIQSQERTPVDRTAFYKAPKGLVQFHTPKQKCRVTFDVLGFQYTKPYHPKFLKAGVWDITGKFFWNYHISVHECFPKTVVCRKNFELGKRAVKDGVCTYMWENQDIDFKKVNHNYVVMFLRLHPNKELGINDYTYAYHIDTPGKLYAAIDKEYEKYINRDDDSKRDFYFWDSRGLSVEAYFSELPTNMGTKFWGCNDVSFVPRTTPIPDADGEFICGVDICSGIDIPSEEDVADFLAYFKDKAPLKPGAVSNEPPIVAQKPQEADPTFRNPVMGSPADDEDWATTIN